MTQTTILLAVSLIALLTGAGITWLTMRSNARLSAGKARAEVGTELALARQNLQAQEAIRAELEARLAEAERKAAELHDHIGTLRDQLGRAEGEVKAEREARQLLAANVESEQAARTTAESKATGLLAKLEGLEREFAVKEEQFAQKLVFVEEAKRNLSEQFRNLANDILEEKGKRFTEQNQNSLGNLLNPLKNQLSEFKAKVETVYVEEGKERVALQEQVRQLIGMNQTLSEDAKNLTNALKGNNKMQGNWGELVLENILEASGLRRGQEFKVQASHTDEDGRRLQPDVIIHMPEGRSLVVDSKMSLNAYAEYVNAEAGDDAESSLKRHIQSIRNHIKGLSSKNYQDLHQLQTLDFVVMFIPVEPAFLLAVGQDARLYQDAWKEGVLLVSPSTLMFVLRTVEHLWRQEQQNRHAQDIAKRGGELYNKLCLFTEDLAKVESSLEAARNSFGNAKNRLVHQKGSVIRQAQMLTQLGVKANKTLPAGYSPDQSDPDDDPEESPAGTQLMIKHAGSDPDSDQSGNSGAPSIPHPRKPRADSALARCREIYTANIETMEPRDIKQLMAEQTGISDNVASTYFSIIKRNLESTQ